MSIEKVNEYLLIFDQEVGGFDLLEAFHLANCRVLNSPFNI